MRTPAPNAQQIEKVIRAIFAEEPVSVEKVRVNRTGLYILDIITSKGRSSISTPFSATRQSRASVH